MDLLAVFLCSRWQACCKYCSDIQSDIMQWSCFVYLCPLVFFIIYHESKIVSFFKVIMLGLACKACTGVFYFLKKGGIPTRHFVCVQDQGKYSIYTSRALWEVKFIDCELHLGLSKGSTARIDCILWRNSRRSNENHHLTPASLRWWPVRATSSSQHHHYQLSSPVHQKALSRDLESGPVKLKEFGKNGGREKKILQTSIRRLLKITSGLKEQKLLFSHLLGLFPFSPSSFPLPLPTFSSPVSSSLTHLHTHTRIPLPSQVHHTGP